MRPSPISRLSSGFRTGEGRTKRYVGRERDERRERGGKRVPFTSGGLAESLQSEGIFHAALLRDSLSSLLFFPDGPP